MKAKKAPLFLSMALAASLMAVPAYAAGTPLNAPGESETPVLIEAEATTFSVTVPTNIPLLVKADGTVGVPTDLKIVNASAGKVKVSNITAADGSWTLVDYNNGNRADLAKDKVDAKKLGLSLTAGGNAVTSLGSNALTKVDSTKWVVDGADINGDGSIVVKDLPITVGAIATAVSTPGTFEGDNAAAKIVFTVGWDAQS